MNHLHLLHLLHGLKQVLRSQIGDRLGGRARVRAKPDRGCRGRPIASDYKQSESKLRYVWFSSPGSDSTGMCGSPRPGCHENKLELGMCGSPRPLTYRMMPPRLT
uniref:Uncharacterized protein n=1 Tax=Ananas comosus var. bracteatus TaxID=296719 RepID=A0A6V7P2B3_ANACO|nr:unnamed protein product [Ananas comosus var. bracteatus]